MVSRCSLLVVRLFPTLGSSQEDADTERYGGGPVGASIKKNHVAVAVAVQLSSVVTLLVTCSQEDADTERYGGDPVGASIKKNHGAVAIELLLSVVNI